MLTFPIIIDDADTNATEFTLTGSWYTVAAGYAGQEHHAEGAGNVATWTWSGLAPGDYLVAITYTGDSGYSEGPTFAVLDGAATVGSGTLSQRIAPDDFIASNAGWRWLGRFTIAGTSLTLQLHSGPVNVTVADAAYLTTPDGVTTLASKQDGDWSDLATWNPPLGRAPLPTDTVRVNHNVRVTSNTTVGDGSATVAMACDTGTLTVSGATLTVRSPITFSKYLGSSTLTILPNGTTPGGIEFDGDIGVSPTISFDDGGRLVMPGTPSTRCFVRTKLATTGNPGYLFGVGTHDSWYADVAHAEFIRLGDLTHAGINSSALSDANPDPIFSFADCNFVNCSASPAVNFLANSGGVKFALADCSWIIDIPGYKGFIIQANDGPLAAGTRLIDRCDLSLRPGRSALRDFTVTNNYFDNGYENIGNTLYWNSFTGNLFVKRDAFISGLIGDVVGNYFLFLQPNDGSDVNGMVTGGQAATAITDNVCQYVGGGGATASELTSFFGCTEGNNQDAGGNQVMSRTIDCSRNLVIPPQGGGSRALIGVTSNLDPSLPANFTTLDHNTICTHGNLVAGCGGVIGTRAGAVASFRSNVFFDDSGHHDINFAFLNLVSGPPAELDVIVAGGADHNAWLGLATVPPGTWNDAADGTIYSTPSSVVPGVHDLPGTDPQFVDKTRDIATWDAMLGGLGTIDSAIARVKADLSLTASSLIPWVKAGFAPTNPALHGTAHDGTDIGAVAWQSGAPATSYTITGPSAGTVGVASSAFTVTPGGPYTGTITPSNSTGGTFTPTMLAWAASDLPQTFTYTASAAGTSTVGTASDPSLSVVGGLTFIASDVVVDPPPPPQVQSIGIAASPTGLVVTIDGKSTHPITLPADKATVQDMINNLFY